MLTLKGVSILFDEQLTTICSSRNSQVPVSHSL